MSSAPRGHPAQTRAGPPWSDSPNPSRSRRPRQSTTPSSSWSSRGRARERSRGSSGDQLLVNQRIHSSQQELRMGDQVEMVSSGYAEEFFESDGEDASFLSEGEESEGEYHDQLEFERAKLSRMYSSRMRKQRAHN